MPTAWLALMKSVTSACGAPEAAASSETAAGLLHHGGRDAEMAREFALDLRPARQLETAGRRAATRLQPARAGFQSCVPAQSRTVAAHGPCAPFPARCTSTSSQALNRLLERIAESLRLACRRSVIQLAVRHRSVQLSPSQAIRTGSIGCSCRAARLPPIFSSRSTLRPVPQSSTSTTSGSGSGSSTTDRRHCHGARPRLGARAAARPGFCRIRLQPRDPDHPGTRPLTAPARQLFWPRRWRRPLREGPASEPPRVRRPPRSGYRPGFRPRAA